MPFWRSRGKTKVLHRTGVINSILDIFTNANQTVNVCGNPKFPSTMLSLESTRKTIVATKTRGIQQRFVIEIRKENLQYCKDLIRLNCDLRHSNEIESNFVLNEKEYIGSIILMEPHQQAIYSNIREVVEQYQHMFETLWNKAIPATQKIKEIEQGMEPEFYEVITDSKKATQAYTELARSIQKEGLLMLANKKAILRAQRAGIIDHLLEAALKKEAVIKIICPLAEVNMSIIKTISEKAPDIRILDYDSKNIESGMFIVDRTRFMRFDLKEPEALDFSDAIGFIVYSNNKVGVESSRSVFDLIWNERIQNDKLKEYEKLKEAERMQTEFINIAAHELRTPVQPILGLSDILSSQISDSEQLQLISAIHRNAKRLLRLADDILDVTRIESNSLKLKKENFDLRELILALVNEYSSPVKKDNKKINLVYESKGDGDNDYTIHADKSRLNQVLSNLVDNAIKFTAGGTITITTEKTLKTKGKGRDGGGRGRERGELELGEVILSIMDSGTGIDGEIMPKLFSKFASKSFAGIGLALFISKSIIESHGGRIWAENNPDGRGATFAFTLPLSKQALPIKEAVNK